MEKEKLPEGAAGITVLSLFDGMSCGQQALDRLGVKVDAYYASEIDKHAITVTMANYPNTIQIGSVTEVDGYKLPKIDLLMGGSPCQSFSFAGKGGTGPLSRTDGKTYCLDTGHTNAIEFIVASRGRNPENPKSRQSGLNTEQMLEPRHDGKTNCLTSVQKDNLVMQATGPRIRRLTPTECERLQTVKDGYTGQASETCRS